MKPLLAITALVVALGVPNLRAADFWNKKQPGEWSNDEVRKLLTNSPWAKSAKVTATAGGGGDRAGRPGGGQSGGGYPGGGGRNAGGMPRIGVGGRGGIRLPGGGDGIPGGIPGGGGRGGSGRASAGPVPKIVVRWNSALPIRQAVRERATDDPCALDSASNDYYTVCAVGLPAMNQRPRNGGDDPGDETSQAARERMRRTLMAQTSLHGKDQASVFPERVEVLQKAGTRAAVFMFKKGNGIEDNKELEFMSQAGRYRFKATFKPKEMKYRGRTEL